MRTLLGVVGIIAGVVLGLFVGVYVCFIGGILGLITAFLALLGGHILTGVIVLSIVKIMFAGLLGWISGAVLILPSWTMIVSK
jgi:hypothetical protein